MRWLITVVIASGCGRVGFDALASDGGVNGDGQLLVTYRQAVLVDAPIAYWRLGDVLPTARDELGQHDGTYVGTCAHGQVGLLANDADRAVEFDGSTCQILPAAIPTFSGVAPFSLEVWLSLSNTTNYQFVLMVETRNAIDPINGYALLNAPGGVIFERVKSLVNTQTVPVPLLPRIPVHVVGVYDGGALRIFVDGVLAGAPVQDPMSMPSHTPTAVIGSSPMSTVFVGGVVDEVAIYDHALAPERIDIHHRIGMVGPQ